MITKSAGFTLLELLVVIAIIGLLSAVVFGSLSDAKDKSKEVVTLKEVRGLNEAIFMYELDTSMKFECNVNQDCTQNLTVNPGIAGWDGPYYQAVNHSWGGPVIITKKFNLANSTSTANETLIYLSSGPENRFRIPDNSMREIDKRLDDGVANTGSITFIPTGAIRVFVPGFLGAGEMLIKPEI